MRVAFYVRRAEVFSEIRDVLAAAGFRCERFESQIAFVRAIRRESYDLILADTSPDAADNELFYCWLSCRSQDRVPVVVLAPGFDAHAMALALDMGADDYINRPCNPELLVARLRVVVRRSRPRVATGVVKLLGFELDKERQQLCDRGKPVDLTPREFALGWLLFSSPGTFLSHDTISAALLTMGDDIAKHTIEQHVYKLRKKLNLCPARGLYIRNAYIRGYCLEVCEEAQLQTEDLA